MAVQQYLMMGRAASGRTIITGEMWAVGRNYQVGQLGLGDLTDRTDFVQIPGTTWQNTMPGGGADQRRLTVKSDGTLWSWGRGNYGALGHNNTTNYSTPTQVGSDTDWLEVGSAYIQALAIKTDGTLWSWGYNGTGQLGHGDTTDRSSPTQVGSDTDWAHVIGGNTTGSSAVMKTDGSIYWCGDWTGPDISTITQIGSETGFVDAVSVGAGASGTAIYAWKEA